MNQTLKNRLRAWEPLLTYAAPSLLVLILSIPVLSFPFIADDYNFIERARNFSIGQLLPDPRVIYYRPLSREAYFAFLVAVGRNNPNWGHAFNLILALACAALVVSIGKHLAGNTAGLLAGLLFASVGVLPCLIGWISGSQDLFAILFTLTAIRLQLDGRTWPAVAAMSAALLSKENAVFFLPGLALIRPLALGDRSSLRRDLIRFAGLGLAWGLLNFTWRGLLAKSITSGAGGYTGFDNPLFLRNAGFELAALANIPIGKSHWPARLGVVAGVGVLLVGAAIYPMVAAHGRKGSGGSRSRALLLGGLLGILPAILTGLIAKHWFPYYACFPAVGIVLMMALHLSRHGRTEVITVVAVYLALGIWMRGLEQGTRIMPNENNFAELAGPLRRIEHNLLALHPALPDSSRLYVAVNAPLVSGLQHQLFVVQGPRTWYWNSTLVTDSPEKQHPSAASEYLFWATPSGDVFEIRLPGLQVRSSGPRPDYGDYQSTIRTYSYGLAAVGQVDRAVGTLLQMQEQDNLSLGFDRRLAGTFLYAAGRDAEAAQICRGLVPLPKQEALYAVAATLKPELGLLRLDQAALRAYGISPDDAESYRFLMFWFSDREQLVRTKRMAERLQTLLPGDPEAAQMLEALKQVPAWEPPVLPVKLLEEQ